MRYPTERPPVFTLTAGPVDAYPEVLRAMGTTVLYDYDPAFQAFYESVARKAARVMGTDEPPLILHGEPVLGLEAAAASLIDCSRVRRRSGWICGSAAAAQKEPGSQGRT